VGGFVLFVNLVSNSLWPLEEDQHKEQFQYLRLCS
jgi:hypothetical protein